MSRREFVARTGRVAVAGAVGVTVFDLMGCTRPLGWRRPEAGVLDPPGPPLTSAQWRTMEAVQSVMLPSAQNSPGAKEVRATAYLDAAIVDPWMRPEVAQEIRDGLRALDRASDGFAALDESARAAALRAFQDDGEKDWVYSVLDLTLEAFFGDPVHGVNPDGIGWKWAGVRPGYPRPPVPR